MIMNGSYYNMLQLFIIHDYEWLKIIMCLNNYDYECLVEIIRLLC